MSMFRNYFVNLFEAGDKMSRRNDYDQQQILHIIRRLEHALSDIEYGSDNVGLSENEIDSLQKMLEAVKIEKHKKAEAERERKKRREEAEKRRREEEARAAQLAIEKHERHVQKVTSMELPMDWENFYASDETVLKNHTESIPDAYVKCLNQKGCVDIEYIAALSGSDCKTVIEKLKGSVYQNPETWGECFYKGFEPADQYLSGNIRKKLAIAKKADEEYHGYFKAQAAKAVAMQRVLTESPYCGNVPVFAERYLEELKKSQTDWRTILTEFIQEDIVDFSMRQWSRRNRSWMEANFYSFVQKEAAVRHSCRSFNMWQKRCGMILPSASSFRQMAMHRTQKSVRHRVLYPFQYCNFNIIYYIV